MAYTVRMSETLNSEPTKPVVRDTEPSQIRARAREEAIAAFVSEHSEDMARYNAHVEAHGLWNDPARPW